MAERHFVMSPKNSMRLRLIAFDYDGTLADDGGISPATLEALAEAKRAGFLLGLVTGRPHDELLGICPEIGLFDLVVDENGSVLHFSGTGAVEDLGPSLPERFSEELARRYTRSGRRPWSRSSDRSRTRAG